MELQKIDNKNKLLPLFILLFIAIIGYFVGPKLIKHIAQKFYSQSAPFDLTKGQIEGSNETSELEILKSDNEEDVTETKTVELEGQNDDDHINEVETIDVINIEQVYETIDAYREFLFNTNQLIVKFLTDQPFTSYLNEVEIIEMPKNIYKIINNMQKLDQLKQQISNNDSISSSSFSKILHNFVKIKKIPKESAEIESLRQNIRQNLSFLIEFFYSQEVQNSFIGN